MGYVLWLYRSEFTSVYFIVSCNS